MNTRVSSCGEDQLEQRAICSLSIDSMSQAGLWVRHYASEVGWSNWLIANAILSFRGTLTNSKWPKKTHLSNPIWAEIYGFSTSQSLKVLQSSNNSASLNILTRFKGTNASWVLPEMGVFCTPVYQEKQKTFDTATGLNQFEFYL